MHSWVESLRELAASHAPVVLLTVVSVRGSAPREVGAKMIITEKESIGTIGGGQLEYQCVQLAVKQLQNRAALDDYGPQTRRFALGANCGQCCGGVVGVMFELLAEAGTDWTRALIENYNVQKPAVIVTGLKGQQTKLVVTNEGCAAYGRDDPAAENLLEQARSLLHSRGTTQTVDDYIMETVRDSEFSIAIFGAGHVGAATVDVLSRLDCRIRWIDSRRNIFPDKVSGNVTCIESPDPAREISALPDTTYFLVMTHSHPLDQEICQKVLSRENFVYCGLIGSQAKRRRFERAMRKQGMPQHSLDRLVCPIGIAGIKGKRPVEIALAVAAEILQLKDAKLQSGSTPVFCELTA